jgi:phosphoribosylglycinamide formyltransferase 1
VKKILFLASGGGGNFKFIHQAILCGVLAPVELYVIADQNCGTIEYAKKVGINNSVIQYARSAPGELRSHLLSVSPDLIITNWHKIIDSDTVRAHEGKFINLHYSLLPSFGGLIGIEPIKKAYEHGCKFIGPTCHFVDEGVDTGKIIAQAIFSTDRSFDESVTMMFRSGCLVLLSAIKFNLYGNESNSAQHPFDSNVLFSPAPKSELNFDEQFWTRVASV